MGKLLKQYLPGPQVYCCAACNAHVCEHSGIISKNFQGRTGKAFLFGSVVNVNIGPKEDRMLMTGLHTVSDVFCGGCSSLLGWTYHAASDESQAYKIGKYIIERALISRSDDWKGPADSA